MRVAIALSGGVDSAVAAALLLKQGLEVVGVHLRLSEAGPPREYLEDLARVLGLPLTVLDLRPEFAREVVDYFAAEYLQGRTPNPCVKCNAAIKFGHLWRRLEGQGFEFLATGHYARIMSGPDGALGLYRGLDRSKDQSYFLSRLPREMLPHLIFPLGEMTKEKVRARARNLGLPRGESCRESQEICFVPEGSHPEFIQARLGRKGAPGELVDRQGLVLGRHRGLEHYTVGQRRGLGVPAREPYYVLEIHPETNRVVVGPKRELFSSGLIARAVNWLIPPPPGELEALAVIRYRHPGAPSRIRLQDPDKVEVIFQEPQSAIAPGQALALYRDDRLLAGGWIEERIG